MAITDGLRRRGYDVVTAQEDGSARLDDELLLERITRLERVLFSQDRDFLAIAHRWQQTNRPFYGVIYAHQLTITVGQAVRDLALMMEALDPEDMRGQIEFLPL